MSARMATCIAKLLVIDSEAPIKDSFTLSFRLCGQPKG